MASDFINICTVRITHECQRFQRLSIVDPTLLSQKLYTKKCGASPPLTCLIPRSGQTLCYRSLTENIEVVRDGRSRVPRW
jgi:hypothetical protein